MNKLSEKKLIRSKTLSIWPFTLAWQQYYTLQHELALSHHFWKPPTSLKIIFLSVWPIIRDPEAVRLPSHVVPLYSAPLSNFSARLTTTCSLLRRGWLRRFTWQKACMMIVRYRIWESCDMRCGWPRLMYAQCSLAYWHRLLFILKYW